MKNVDCDHRCLEISSYEHINNNALYLWRAIDL